MTDKLTPEKRSWNMSRIKGRDTAPELAVRKLLHAAGYRFRLHRKDLPGRPDTVLPKCGTVIFMHGCFWHGHENCPDFKVPKSRREWGQAKISGNRSRDKRVESELRAMGWHDVTIWACATPRCGWNRGYHR